MTDRGLVNPDFFEQVRYERLLSTSSEAMAAESAPSPISEFIKDPYVLECWQHTA